MTFDRQLTVYSLSSGTPLTGKLCELSTHLYAEAEVYHARYFESVQAGSAVDMIVQLPDGKHITANLYCIPEDGHVYRIVQAQQGIDENGLPLTTLSLHRAEGNYDIAKS